MGNRGRQSPEPRATVLMPTGSDEYLPVHRAPDLGYGPVLKQCTSPEIRKWGRFENMGVGGSVLRAALSLRYEHHEAMTIAEKAYGGVIERLVLFAEKSHSEPLRNMALYELSLSARRIGGLAVMPPEKVLDRLEAAVQTSRELARSLGKKIPGPLDVYVDRQIVFPLTRSIFTPDEIEEARKKWHAMRRSQGAPPAPRISETQREYQERRSRASTG